jgi:hypothetical protein
MAAKFSAWSKDSMTNNQRRHCQIKIAIVALFSASLLGCGGQKAYHLSGSVTFKGNPIPEGYIVFEPDGREGNSGSSGYSKILDGKYNTRNSDGMPVVGGPHVIRIVAHSARVQTGTLEGGGGEVDLPPLLFPPYSFNQDLPTTNSKVDFDVPAAAAD